MVADSRASGIEGQVVIRPVRPVTRRGVANQAPYQAKISVLDSGFNAGDGVYDVTRTFGHKPFRLRDHTARLFRSLRYTRIDCGISPGDMEKVTLEVFERNRRRSGDLAGGKPGNTLIARKSNDRKSDGGDLLHQHCLRGIRAPLRRRRQARHSFDTAHPAAVSGAQGEDQQ